MLVWMRRTIVPDAPAAPAARDARARGTPNIAAGTRVAPAIPALSCTLRRGGPGRR
jgi:hypothetical protein